MPATPNIYCHVLFTKSVTVNCTQLSINFSFVICFANSSASAKWLVCKYSLTGRCELINDVRLFSLKGSMTKLPAHVVTHENRENILSGLILFDVGEGKIVHQLAACAAVL